MDRARVSAWEMTTRELPRGSWLTSLFRSSPLLVGAVLSLVAVDAFDTGEDLGRWTATAFWIALVGINVAVWKIWSVVFGGGARRRIARLLGAIILNGMLTLEVPLLYRSVGVHASPNWRVFVYGLVATGLIAYAKRLADARDCRSRVVGSAYAHLPPNRSSASSDRSLPSLLIRAGVTDGGELLSIRAEDHYCRLMLRDGSSRLVHSRFRDAVAALAPLDGAQVRRGAWVAAHAVRGGRRIGRRWSLELVDGTLLPISETSLALCRDRGWLTPPA